MRIRTHKFLNLVSGVKSRQAEVAIILQKSKISGGILTDSCTLPTVEIMGIQNINFAVKFSQNGLLAPIFTSLDTNFLPKIFGQIIGQ